MCAVAEAFGLSHPDSYHYLRQSDCPADTTINDKGTFQDVLVGTSVLGAAASVSACQVSVCLMLVCLPSQNAMRTMQFAEENIGEILRLLAGILHTGNIEFMTAGGAQIASKSGFHIGALSLSSCLLRSFRQRLHSCRRGFIPGDGVS